MEDSMKWAKELQNRNAVVMHRTTFAVGRIARVWSGAEGDQYIPPKGTRPVDAFVIELDSGHSFLDASEETMVELDEKSAHLYTFFSEMVKSAVRAAAIVARTSRVAPDVAIGIVVDVLTVAAGRLREETDVPL